MTNLPAERADELVALIALTGQQSSLFDDDPRRMLGLNDGEFAALVADVARHGDSVFAGIRKVVGLLAWAAWHRYDEKRYREFVADFAGRLGVESRVILDWRRKAAKGLPMPAMAQARSDARKSAGQGPVNTSGRIIPAASTEAPAKPSEGGEQVGETRPVPLSQPPSGKSSEGVGHAREGLPAPSVSHPAPSDPPRNDTGRPVGGRQLAALVYAAMREVDPTDAGPVTTPEEATFLRQWAQRTLDAWKAVYAPPAPAEKPQRRQGTAAYDMMAEQHDAAAPKPQRRQGTITRPNGHAFASPPNGMVPKGKRHALDCSCLGCKPAKAAAK